MDASMLTPPLPKHPTSPSSARPPRPPRPPRGPRTDRPTPRPPPQNAMPMWPSETSNKRKAESLPSEKNAKKAKAEPSPTDAERRQRRLDRKVADCILNRGSPSAKQTVLRCCCAELPPGTPCALHQTAQGRVWMRGLVYEFPHVEIDEEVPVPQACADRQFAAYMRWRKCVRMPSRFYLESVRSLESAERDGFGATDVPLGFC